MLGDTITLDLSALGSEDPEEIILKKINQDGYSAEYRLKVEDREHVVLVRHAKENSRLKGKAVDRHNVTYTQNIFPSELSPQGETVQVYTVFRVNPERPNADTTPMVNALTRFAAENGDALINWES